MAVIVFSQETIKVKQYYSKREGKLKSVYHVLKTDSMIFHGWYKEYYPSQRVKISGHYADGIPVGKWGYFYENGYRKMEAYLEPGNPTYWKYYYENDSLKMEGEIAHQNKQGPWVFYYEDGEVKSRGEYRDGKKHGLWEHYYTEGEIKAVANYVMGEGEYTEYYYKGGVKREGPTKNNYSEGLWTYYYESGEVKAKGYKHNGVKHGEWQYFYVTGELSAKGKYENGDQIGEWVYYHENGKISSKGQLVEGKKDGHWNLYNTNGEFKGEAIFELGNGEYKEYYDSGDLKVKGEIYNGKSHGLWEYYYQNGNLEGQCDFKEGRGEYIGYYPGKQSVQMTGVIENGEKVGVWVLYDEFGEEAGYYKTIHSHDDTTSYKSITELESLSMSTDSKVDPDSNIVSHSLPTYVKPKKPKRSRNTNKGIRKYYYFKPHRHEYRSVIANINPLGVVYGVVPISLEYHFQDRLGYELMYSWLNYPAFIGTSKIENDVLWRRGSSFELKQKLYNPTKNMGHVYFGQSFGYSSVTYGSRITNPLNDGENKELRAYNDEVYYSLFAGNRLGTYFYHGFVFDIYVGLGVGYRWHSQNFEEGVPEYDEVFLPVKTKEFVLKPNFGFTFGYIF